MPRLSRELAKGEVDVAAPVDRAERLENDLRVGLEDDERFVEERERGMCARRGADGVALLDEVVRRCSHKVRRAVTHLDGALEDGQIRARRDDHRLSHENAGGGHNEQEDRSERAGERECTTRALLLRKRRDRNERYECRCVRVVDGITNFGERRGDDLEIDASEHVLGLALGRVIKRIGHRERRARASELDEGDGAQLAEAARELTDDGRFGRNA